MIPKHTIINLMHSVLLAKEEQSLPFQQTCSGGRLRVVLCLSLIHHEAWNKMSCLELMVSVRVVISVIQYWIPSETQSTGQNCFSRTVMNWNREADWNWGVKWTHWNSTHSLFYHHPVSQSCGSSAIRAVRYDEIENHPAFHIVDFRLFCSVIIYTLYDANIFQHLYAFVWDVATTGALNTSQILGAAKATLASTRLGFFPLAKHVDIINWYNH